MQELGVETRVSEIEAFCKKWDIVEMSLFGSVLRDGFTPESDIEVMIVFGDGGRHSLFALMQMRGELEDIFGREVDIVNRRTVELSRNKIRREAILGSARVIYATG